MTTVQDIFALLSRLRLPLSDEKLLQETIAEAFDRAGILHLREDRLSDKDVIDFTVGRIGIEVKIKGARRAIFNQVCRYAEHDRIKELILITNVATGFPAELNGKPVFVLNLAKAWL